MSFGKSPVFLLNFSESEMKGEAQHSYRFKSFRLDVEDRRLFRDGVPVQLEPKAFDALALLVENSGHLVEKDELLQAVWADSFVEEANVARVIYTLRKTLGENENGSKYIETVAKKGYRFVAEVEEFCESPEPETNGRQLAAAVGSQNGANEKPSTVNRRPPTETKPKMRIILFSVGFLTAVFLLLMLSFNFRSGSAVKPNMVKSIAVLPLKPINAAARDELYEIGIADSLIYRLGTMKGIIVRPLGATRQYSDVAQDPLAAGREQQADYVLAANYQTVDGKIRITAQLFDVATGQIEETYKTEKDAGDIFALQDTIASDIGNLLQTRFALTANNTTTRRGTNNEEAYRLYLQGKNLTMKRLTEEHRKAIGYFEQAIRLDPNYALAFARMGHAHIWAGLDEPPVRAAKIKEMVKKALELDPNMAEAYVTRANVELIYDWDFPAVEKDLLRAIELEPNNDTAHWLYALLLSYRGRFDEALQEIDTARTIDPGAVMYLRDRGRILYYARRYDEAIAELKRSVDLDENLGMVWLRMAYAVKGDDAQTFETYMRTLKRTNPDRVESIQKIYETEGMQGARRKMLEFSKLDGENPYGLCALMGEKDLAFEYLNKAVENREWRIVMLNVDPMLDNLRDDPRFAEVVRRVGLK